MPAKPITKLSGMARQRPWRKNRRRRSAVQTTRPNYVDINGEPTKKALGDY